MDGVPGGSGCRQKLDKTGDSQAMEIFEVKLVIRRSAVLLIYDRVRADLRVYDHKAFAGFPNERY